MLRITLILLLNISFVFSQDIYSNLIESEKKWVDSVYSSLTLEEKVSQLFINWVSPEQSDFDDIQKLVVEDKIGGLIFSIGTTNTHIEWLNKFQALAKTPLLVTMDAEWGPSQRLSDVFAHPWNMTLGAIQDNSLTFSQEYCEEENENYHWVEVECPVRNSYQYQLDNNDLIIVTETKKMIFKDFPYSDVWFEPNRW